MFATSSSKLDCVCTVKITGSNWNRKPFKLKMDALLKKIRWIHQINKVLLCIVAAFYFFFIRCCIFYRMTMRNCSKRSEWFRLNRKSIQTCLTYSMKKIIREFGITSSNFKPLTENVSQHTTWLLKHTV